MITDFFVFRFLTRRKIRVVLKILSFSIKQIKIQHEHFKIKDILLPKSEIIAFIKYLINMFYIYSIVMRFIRLDWRQNMFIKKCLDNNILTSLLFLKVLYIVTRYGMLINLILYNIFKLLKLKMFIRLHCIYGLFLILCTIIVFHGYKLK